RPHHPRQPSKMVNHFRHYPRHAFSWKGAKGTYLLLDGHLRLKALQELERPTAPCLVSTDDDAFTYNDKVNRLSLIQEHRMIMKALEGGVSEKQIAEALDLDVRKIIQGKNLLEGLHPEVVQILKDKPITERALRILKQVKALRQIEMSQLMVSGNNYTFAYARALLVGTARDQLAKPEEPKRVKGLSAEEIARMEREMESLERDFRVFQDQFGQNTLHLGAAQRYLRRLLDNTKVKRFLQQRHPEILEELNDIAALESL
ncbi:MAG: plasmid partitioning protein RepB C-terminal domain-containing protein, partial [Candidatus Didemnitutus sp.]|nr:plasmid partitioning protein RepB C-terminal domain-containing protein [Candidatus Didemnitutus sp.]